MKLLRQIFISFNITVKLLPIIIEGLSFFSPPINFVQNVPYHNEEEVVTKSTPKRAPTSKLLIGTSQKEDKY